MFFIYRLCTTNEYQALAAKAAGQDALFKVAGAVGVDSSGIPLLLQHILQ